MVANLISATVYMGRVTDRNGQGLGYATVYPINDPVAGTATNHEGYFSFETILAPNSQIIISYIGYEKQILTLPDSQSINTSFSEAVQSIIPDTVVFPTIVLTEQPIGLEEMVVSAKKPKYANKRKQMA
ncbi:MAG: carboxypeptidase-like regulatory domain-containing protein, partial [Paludibacteraceae bacterium]|nr:carboxypeptidase-like regulatory domain-containing protein [Paludibacteraceae bacterium]